MPKLATHRHAAATGARTGAPGARPYTWPEFTARLTEVLAVVGPDEYLILSHPRSQGFVQFAPGGDEGLRAEAKSSHYFPPARQLQMSQELRLVELGWAAPTHGDGEEPVANGSPNWFRDWEAPVDLRQVAEVAVLTLREVYGVRTPGALRYHAFRAGGGEIRLPTLGLPHDGSRTGSPPPRPEWLGELKELVTQAIVRRAPWMGIRRLENGDLRTDLADTTVLVREEADPFHLQFYSVLLSEVEESPGLLAVVNQLNARLMLGRAFHHGGRLAVDWMMHASLFDAEQFVEVLVRTHGAVSAVREWL
ncbi:MAG: hypothetical protein ABR602_14710, partial [Gemmatimonadales bacterium]